MNVLVKLEGTGRAAFQRDAHMQDHEIRKPCGSLCCSHAGRNGDAAGDVSGACL